MPSCGSLTARRRPNSISISSWTTTPPHQHPKVQAWLARRPRFHLHFTPTSASWLNQVERWFGLISQRAIKRGSFDSVSQRVQTIEAFIANHNASASPFIWAATAESIFTKLERLSERIGGTPH